MLGIGRRLAVGAGVMALVAAGLVGSAAPSAYAGVTVGDWASDQAHADAAYGTPDNTGTNAGWADMAGGLTARPYVTSLSVTNGDTTTQIMSATAPTEETLAPGQVGAVVSPVNLCPAGQPAQPGQCYASPNRVQIDLVYGAENGAGWNFDAPRVDTLTPAVTRDTVIDMTIALNTLGRSLRWSEVTGELIDWKNDKLGRDDATIHVKFRPVTTPYVTQEHWPANNGCTATPIFNCELGQAEAEVVRASLLLSLDDTLDPALTGAAFATRDIIAGYLAPDHSSDEPALGIQAASTHLDSQGALQHGTIQAFLPAGALLNLYGVLPSDAGSFFSAGRFDSAGHNDPPTYAPWVDSDTRSEGVLVTITGITFSTPRYKVRSRLAHVGTSAKVAGKNATVRATVAACTKKAPCVASVYRLTKAAASRYLGTRTPVLVNRAVTAKALSLAVAATALRKGDRYLLVVRAVSTKRPIVSSLGGVS